jgi:hypothetical protein
VPAYIELPIDGDETIKVEISHQGLVHAGAGDVIGKASERLDHAVDQVVKMGQRPSARPARRRSRRARSRWSSVSS